MIFFLKIYDFDPSVSGLRQKDPGFLGILGKAPGLLGIVGKAPGLLERVLTRAASRPSIGARSAPAFPRLPRVTNHLKVSRGHPKVHEILLNDS